jgi:molybdopterin synthase sulfur carrier subunit
MPNIKLFAGLRKLAGTKEVSITGACLGEVLSELVKRYPPLAAQLLDNGQIRPHVILTLNGHPTADLEAAVTEQDQIAIFPPIAGG